MTKIIIVEAIGKTSAILHSDGLIVYEKLKASELPIELCFSGIDHCTTAFLNASVGKLLIEEPDKAKQIKYTGIEGNDYLQSKVDLVLQNATNEKKKDQPR